MEELANAPLLSIIILLPLAGALLLMLVPPDRTRYIKWFAFWTSIAAFAISLLLLVGNRDFSEFSHEEFYGWLPQIGVNYHLGVDGLSMWLILLTALLVPVSILSSFSAIKNREKEYYILLLIMGTALTGTFAALDLILFFFFWEGVLIPMYLLIGIWGSGRRVYAATKFVLYTVVGSFFMLLAIIGLYVYSGEVGRASFDFLQLRNAVLPPEMQTWLFLAFALAFAIKVPLFPFHTWLADAHTEAPTAGSVLLAGVLLKMGGYGFIRFCLTLFPDAAVNFAPLMMGLAVVSIIYGAIVCAAQTDLKRLIAISSVAHMGFVVLGIFALSGNPIGQVGATIQMISHGLSTGALFLLVGVIYERRHTRELAEYGGLAAVMPRYYNVFMIVMLASVGLPALNGFVGEFLILMGAMAVDWLFAGLGTFGVVLAAIYLLLMMKKMFHGECTNPKNLGLPDLNLREYVYIIPLVVLMFAIGLYPKPYLDVITPAADRVVRGINNYLPEQLRADRSGEKAAAILAELGVAAKPEGGER
jgi:NADH-quinone oxidoreductase subunit M